MVAFWKIILTKLTLSIQFSGRQRVVDSGSTHWHHKSFSRQQKIHWRKFHFVICTLQTLFITFMYLFLFIVPSEIISPKHIIELSQQKGCAVRVDWMMCGVLVGIHTFEPERGRRQVNERKSGEAERKYLKTWRVWQEREVWRVECDPRASRVKGFLFSLRRKTNTALYTCFYISYINLKLLISHKILLWSLLNNMHDNCEI